MRTFDLHGKRVSDAESLFESQLNEARIKNSLIEVTFITGSGVIRDRLLALAKDHELYHYVPMANRGCIVVEFE